MPNGKIYIGSGVNLYKRFGEHAQALRKGTHDSPQLQAAYNKYGAESFLIGVVTLCTKEAILAEEQRLLDALRPWEKPVGFNTLRIAGNCAGRKFSAATLLKMSRARKGRKVTGQALENMRAAANLRRGVKRPASVGVKIANILASDYVFQYKNGRICRGRNVRAFALLEGLSQPCLNSLKLGHCSQYKGWHLPTTPWLPAPKNLVTIVAPSGMQVTTDNFTAFCRRNNLNSANMSLVKQGVRKHHKGWHLPGTDMTGTYTNPNYKRKKHAGPFYKVKGPDGEIIEVKNQTQFCKDRGLLQPAFNSMLKKRTKSHKGYTLYVD